MIDESLSFSAALSVCAESVTRELEAVLETAPRRGEIARPEHLMAAMRHGALNGGKRLRPFLVIETARLCGGEAQAALTVATALECVHCYSLIHDDLPAMDDDRLRRGQPTVHVAFDEATAILAGDALLTLAFDLIASPAKEGLGRVDPAARLELVAMLAKAAGVGGMVGGQALDLAAEHSRPDAEGVRRLQAMKTGALIRFACEAGAILAGAGSGDRGRLRHFGEIVGLAFQLADDLLDVTADPESLGKAAGKDAGRGKATLVGLYGVDWTRRELSGLIDEAAGLLAPFGKQAERLLEAARFVAARDR